jgi:hypothetical protein
LPALGVVNDARRPAAPKQRFSLQVLDHRRLLPVKPASDQHEQKLK